MSGRNPLYSYLNYLCIWSKAHLLSLLGWMWAFYVLEQILQGISPKWGWANICRLHEEIQATRQETWGGLRQKKPLQLPPQTQVITRWHEKGSTGLFWKNSAILVPSSLHRLSHHLSCNHRTQQGLCSTFKGLFSSLKWHQPPSCHLFPDRSSHSSANHGIPLSPARSEVCNG